MAKSVRASVSKRNRANLRKKVFGPVVDARTERLAAKLQELASQPKPEAPKKSEMELDSDEAGKSVLLSLERTVFLTSMIVLAEQIHNEAKTTQASEGKPPPARKILDLFMAFESVINKALLVQRWTLTPNPRKADPRSQGVCRSGIASLATP